MSCKTINEHLYFYSASVVGRRIKMPPHRQCFTVGGKFNETPLNFVTIKRRKNESKND